MDLELERSAAICASFFPRNVLDGTIVEIENRIFHGRRKGGVGKPWIVMLVDRGWPLANASPKHGRVEDNREGRREKGCVRRRGGGLSDTALNRQSQSDLPLNPSPFSPASRASGKWVSRSQCLGRSIDPRQWARPGMGRKFHPPLPLPMRKSLFLFTEGVNARYPFSRRLVAQAKHVSNRDTKRFSRENDTSLHD